MSKFCENYELYQLLDESLTAEESGDIVDYDEFVLVLQKEME